MKKDIKIVFMGTPDFAVAILDKLVQANKNIVGIITSPDKPTGRGRKVRQSAVKMYADQHGLNTMQPTNLKDASFIEELHSLQADLFVVVAFRMLPEVVWTIPPQGTINLHGSLLPNYRGAAPINWAIINGEEKTGVTTFFIEKEIDTGLVIDRASTTIDENETVGELHDRLMHLGADLILLTVQKIESGTVKGSPQKDFELNQKQHAPKIFKEDCKINFSKNVKAVHNFIRGLDPYPAAWCTFRDKEKQEEKTYKLFGSQVSNEKIKDATSILLEDELLLLPCNDYYLKIKYIQMQGKRKMKVKDFALGNNIEALEVVR